MSLINQMLKDLDARRSEVSGTDLYGGQVRAVPAPRRAHAAWWVALTLGCVLIAVLAWILLRPTAVAITPKMVAQPPLPVALEKRDSAEIIAAPNEPNGAGTPITTANTITTTTTTTTHGAADRIAPSLPSAPSAPSASVPDAGVPVAAAPESLPSRPPAREVIAQAVPDKPHLSSHPSAPVRADMPVRAVAAPEQTKQPKPAPAEAPVPAVEAVPPATPATPVTIAKQIKEATPSQRAEIEYRKALSLVQQGRSNDAIVELERALQLDPAHAAARQLLIKALIDGKQIDEAMRKAQEGLAQAPGQPGLAMILARLQLEKGDLRGAIATLQNNLAGGTENAEYRAFLAALLQRDGRHADAVQHYLQALQRAPQNGVWWMGVGISLQAGNRPGEAQEAFSRAKASNTLSPELLAFVESKLKQLQR